MLTATATKLPPSWKQIVDEVTAITRSNQTMPDDKTLAAYADKLNKETDYEEERETLVSDIGLNQNWSSDIENKLRAMLRLSPKGTSYIISSQSGGGTTSNTTTPSIPGPSAYQAPVTETPYTTYLLIGAGVLAAFWIYSNYGKAKPNT